MCASAYGATSATQIYAEAIRKRFGRIRRREHVEVMAQIPRCREIRRAAVFVPAIPGDRMQSREDISYLGAARFIEGKPEDRKIILDMIALTQAGADDNPSDSGFLQDGPARHIGYGNT